MSARTKIEMSNLELFADNVKSKFFFRQLQKFATLVLPPIVAFDVALNIKALEAPAKAYGDTRKLIIERLAKKDEKGEFVIVSDNYTFESEEVEQQVATELDELDAAKVLVELATFTIDQIAKVEGVTGSMMYSLGQLFVR